MAEQNMYIDYGKWSKTFLKIGFGLYIAVVLLECAMLFVFLY